MVLILKTSQLFYTAYKHKQNKKSHEMKVVATNFSMYG